MFQPSLGLFESSWRFWEPKCWNAQYWPLTWPWPDTWPFKKNFKSALEPSRRDLSNAASPVSLRSLVWELAWGGGRYTPPPRSMAFGWDPGQARVNSHVRPKSAPRQRDFSTIKHSYRSYRNRRRPWSKFWDGKMPTVHPLSLPLMGGDERGWCPARYQACCPGYGLCARAKLSNIISICITYLTMTI